MRTDLRTETSLYNKICWT